MNAGSGAGRRAGRRAASSGCSTCSSRTRRFGEHGYPTDHFFSYLRQLPPSASSSSSGEQPLVSLLDELIGELRPLVESHARALIAGRPGGATGRAKTGEGQAASGSLRFGWAEWWCHSRAR